MTDAHVNPTRSVEKPNKRWSVSALYRSGALTVQEISTQIEELSELQDWVERGPAWGDLVEIKIKYNR
jgi:hypothetical protein